MITHGEGLGSSPTTAVNTHDRRHHTGSLPGFHARLTVLQAGPHERATLAEHLAELLGAVRGGVRVPVYGPDALETAAHDAIEQRLDGHARYRDELNATLRTAREAQAAASARRDEAASRARRLNTHLEECEALFEDTQELSSAVERATQELDARQAELEGARERLAVVLDQREAAEAAIADARAQLAELEASEMDEATLRRKLEEAGSELAEAELAHAEAAEAYQALEAQAYEREAARREVMQERDELIARLESPLYDPGPLRDAVDAYDDEADPDESDPVALSLANEWLEVSDELDRIESALPEPPSQTDLNTAQQQLSEIETVVAELEATSRHSRLEPQARAQIEAAHEAVLAAEEALEEAGPHPGLEQQLDNARLGEQQILAQYGYATYLDLIMAEPEPADAQGELLEALRARRHAEDTLASLWAATEVPPIVTTLHARRERIYREASELLGCDPGDDIVELLEAHPVVPPARTREIADALEAYGVHPAGVSVRDAALDLLLGIEREFDARDDLVQRVDELDAELQALDEQETEAAGEGQELMRSAQAAAADVNSISAEIEELERELFARTSNDERHVQRLAAAEELRSQISAVSEALDRSDDEYHASVADAEAAAIAAEARLEQATAAISNAVRMLRRIGEALPPALRPRATDDPLAELPRLRDALASETERAEAALTSANREFEQARDLIEETQLDMDEHLANGPDDDVTADDLSAAVPHLVGTDSTPILLDDPFTILADSERPAVLEALAIAARQRPTVLLTDEPAILSWAISLPEDAGTVTGLPVGGIEDLTAAGNPDTQETDVIDPETVLPNQPISHT